MNANGQGAAKLIKEYFACPNNEIMALPKEDRVALASGIAKDRGLKPEDLNFEPVNY